MAVAVLPIILALTAAAAPAPTIPAKSFAAPSHVEEAIVEAPIDEIWKIWSTPEGWRIAGVAKAEIDFRPGGLIRTHYREDGVIGDPGTIENRVLAYEPPRMLAIQIAKPPATFPFPNAWREPWTVITLTDRSDGTTSVRIASVGFGSDEESQKMLSFFEKGNRWTLQHIREHFAALKAGKTSGAIGSLTDETRLSRLVIAIRAADYRGEREDLRRLASALDDVKDPALAAHREYWRGFALWRRALNGLNDTPTPTDVTDDLRSAVKSFHSSLERQPDWIEAKIGIFGCDAALLFLKREDQKELRAIVAEVIPIMQEVKDKGAENPRALWMIGGTQLTPHATRPADPLGASATYRRGVEAARREALRIGKGPDWIPTWGAAENLMSLAYLYCHSVLQDRDVAQAYAEGSLVAVPDWHYVRDVLVPQIQALPAPDFARKRAE